MKRTQTWQEVLVEMDERLDRIEHDLDLLIRLQEKLSGTFPRHTRATDDVSVYEERDGVMVRVSGPPIDLPDKEKQAWREREARANTDFEWKQQEC